MPRPPVTDEVDSMTDAEVRRRLVELMEAQNQVSPIRCALMGVLAVTNNLTAENSAPLRMKSNMKNSWRLRA